MKDFKSELVFVDGSKVVTDSLTVAEMFGKEHKNVLADIRTQIEYAGTEFAELNFQPGSYLDKNNQARPKFNLSEEAFTLVVFSYNTKEAVQTKIKFIQEFKRMREYIEQQNKPKSQLEIMQMQIEQMIKQEQEIQGLKETTARIEEKQNNITDILSLNANDWRNKVNKIINAIATKLGGYQYFQEIRNESYKLLEERAACNLSIRLKNRQDKMAGKGMAKTTINKLNRMDIISEDKKLVSVYMTVIKELAVKYQLNLTQYQVMDELE